MIIFGGVSSSRFMRLTVLSGPCCVNYIITLIRKVTQLISKGTEKGLCGAWKPCRGARKVSGLAKKGCSVVRKTFVATKKTELVGLKIGEIEVYFASAGSGLRFVRFFNITVRGA